MLRTGTRVRTRVRVPVWTMDHIPDIAIERSTANLLKILTQVDSSTRVRTRVVLKYSPREMYGPVVYGRASRPTDTT